MLKTLQQLNSEPVVLLVKVDTLQGTNKKGYSIDSKNHLTNAEKGTMQRYQIVKKSPDSTSISLKPCGVTTNHKRKASLEEALTEADSVYEKPKKRKKDDGTSCAKKSKVDKSTRKSEPCVEPKGNNTSSETQLKPCKNKKKEGKRKKKSKEKSSSIQDLGKTAIKCPISAVEKQLSPSEHSAETDRTVVPASQISIRHVPSDTVVSKPTPEDEPVTEEEIFAENMDERSDDLPEDGNSCDIPRSDSAATVELEVDKQSFGSTEDLRPVECVNLVSPDKPKTAKNVKIDEDGFIESDVENEENCKRSSTTDDQKQCEPIRECLENTGLIEGQVELGITKLQSSTVDGKVNISHRIDDASEQLNIDLNKSAQESSASKSENEMNSLGTQSPLLSDPTSDENTQHLANTKALDHPEERDDNKPADVGSEKSIEEGTEMPITSRNVSIEEGPSSIEPMAVEENACLPIKQNYFYLTNISEEELEEEEKRMKQEQDDIQSALAEIVVKHNGAKDELHSLIQKSQALEEELKTKGELISTHSWMVEELLLEVNSSREERNRLAADKKKNHHLVLQTEIKLRELQVQVIRQQLELGDAKLVETHPLYNIINENERLVAELTEEVAAKTARHKESEASYQKAEQLFRQKNEEYESLAKRLEESRLLCEEVRKNLDNIKAEVEDAQRNLQNLMSEGKKKYLRTIEIDTESLRIETCKKFLQYERKRKRIEDMEEEFSFDDFKPHLTPSVATQTDDIEIVQVTSRSSERQQCEQSASQQINTIRLQNLSQATSPRGLGLENRVQVGPVSNSSDENQPLKLQGTESEPIIFCENPMDADQQLNNTLQSSSSSPQIQPICLRVSPTASAGPLMANTDVALSSATSTSRNDSSSTKQGSPLPASSSSSIGIRVVDSLTNSVEPGYTSQNVPCTSVHQLTAKSLHDALRFYDQYPNLNNQSSLLSDENVLFQEVLNGCCQFVRWRKSSNEFRNFSRDASCLKHIAVYVKEFLRPFIRLLHITNNSVHLLVDLVIQQAQNNNWLGKSGLDPALMKSLLEKSLLCAVEIVARSKGTLLPPSRVEFTPSSGSSSLPTFTIHLAAPEQSRPPMLPSNQVQSTSRTCSEQPDVVQINSIPQSECSPIGALSSMLSNQTHQSHHHSPSTLSNSTAQPNNAHLMEGHLNGPRQGWAATTTGNGVVTYQSTVVQNTAVVLPVMNPQYSNRQRMSAIQHQVPVSHANWPLHSAQQQYAQNQAMQPNRISAYQAGHLRQQQPTPVQRPYIMSQQINQTVQHNRTVGPLAMDNLPRQNTPILASTLQAQTIVQQQRAMQHSVSQLPQCQQGTHQAPQHHVASSSITAQGHRLYTAQQVEVARQTAIQRPSQEQLLQAQQQAMYVCLKCGQEANQKCSGCQTTFYCSRECQVAHWEEHNKTCTKQV